MCPNGVAVAANRKLVCKCHFLWYECEWPEAAQSEKASFSLPVLPFFSPSLCSITPSHVSSAEFLPFSPPPPQPGRTRCCVWVAHRVSQPVPPGLPQQAVPAVVEAVSSGELVPGVSGVSSLSPDHGQEGEPAQVHLRTRQSEGFCQIRVHPLIWILTFKTINHFSVSLKKQISLVVPNGLTQSFNSCLHPTNQKKCIYEPFCLVLLDLNKISFIKTGSLKNAPQFKSPNTRCLMFISLTADSTFTLRGSMNYNMSLLWSLTLFTV